MEKKDYLVTVVIIGMVMILTVLFGSVIYLLQSVELTNEDIEEHARTVYIETDAIHFEKTKYQSSSNLRYYNDYTMIITYKDGSKESYPLVWDKGITVKKLTDSDDKSLDKKVSVRLDARDTGNPTLIDEPITLYLSEKSYKDMNKVMKAEVGEEYRENGKEYDGVEYN